MAEIITIKPRPGSKKFKAIRGQMTQFQKISEKGQEFDRSAGEYKAERFPNSRQMFRPMWSRSKNRWLLKSFDTMTDEKQKELDKLVTGCKFKFPDDDPRARQYITSADVFDRRDPFFNHVDLRVITYEGQITLDKERPLDKLMLMALQMHTLFQKGGENINPMLEQRVRYVITDKNVDTKIKKDRRNQAMLASQLYGKLSDAKKVKVAMGLGIISNEKTDSGIIDEVLWDYATDNKSRVSGNTTKQKLFIKMCEATTEELNTRHLIQKAKASGNLRRNKTQGWILFGESIGRNEDQLYAYFNDPENQEMILRLEEALKQ